MSNYEPSITPEMRARYLQRREADLQSLEGAIKTSDYDTLAAIAHVLKGNAATFSFTELEGLAIRLESAALAKSLGEAEACVRSMRSWHTAALA